MMKNILIVKKTKINFSKEVNKATVELGIGFLSAHDRERLEAQIVGIEGVSGST
jgi:hypothetical protein